MFKQINTISIVCIFLITGIFSSGYSEKSNYSLKNCFKNDNSELENIRMLLDQYPDLENEPVFRYLVNGKLESYLDSLNWGGYDGSQNPLRILVWGEEEQLGQRPLTDFLRSLGLYTTCSTSPWWLHRTVLGPMFKIDILIIAAGWEPQILSTKYVELMDYTAQDGGTVLVQAPNTSHVIGLFEYYQSPDISVTISGISSYSTNYFNSSTHCTAQNLSTSYFPQITNQATNLGTAWTKVASNQASGYPCLLVAEYARGYVAFLAGDLATSYTGREAFTLELMNCLGRNVPSAQTFDVLLYQPNSSIRTSTANRLTALGFTVTGTGTLGDLSRTNLQTYEVLIIGRNQDPDDPGGYISRKNDILNWVTYDRGGLIVEDPGFTGNLEIFPSANPFNYKVEISSVSGGTASTILSDRFAVTYELTDSDLPYAYSLPNPATVGGRWKKLVQTSGASPTPVLLYADYYSGNFCFLGGKIDDFPTYPGSNKFFTRLINCMARAYKPLDSILFSVADDNPTWLRGKLGSYFPRTRIEYYSAQSSTPTLETCGQYDGIFSWSWYNYSNGTWMGDRLNSYVNDYNRGVVIASKAFNDGTAKELTGAIQSRSPFIPIPDDNVQYPDTVSSLNINHNLFFGLTKPQALSITDRYRAKVNLRTGTPEIARWDDTPVAFHADTTKIYQYAGGLEFLPGENKLLSCDRDFPADGFSGNYYSYYKGNNSEFDATDPFFLKITPSPTGGEPVPAGDCPSGAGQMAKGVAYDGTYYYYACDNPSQLYKLPTLTGTPVWTISLPFVPGDLAYGDGEIWISSSSENRVYRYTTGGVQLGYINISSMLSSPAGVAFKPGTSVDTLFVSGHRGSYVYGTIYKIADPDGSPTAVDSIPATGFDAVGLAYDGTRLWALFQYPASGPPLDGYNFIAAYGGKLPADKINEDLIENDSPPSPDYFWKYFLGMSNDLKTACINAYPGDYGELTDAAGGDYAARIFANAIKHVTIQPKSSLKQPEIFFDDYPKTIKRADLASWFVRVFNNSASSVTFRFRLRYVTPAGGMSEELKPYSDMTFTLNPYYMSTGKISLLLPSSGMSYGDYRIIGYTIPASPGSIWNEKSEFIANVNGTISFPADSPGENDLDYLKVQDTETEGLKFFLSYEGELLEFH